MSSNEWLTKLSIDEGSVTSTFINPLKWTTAPIALWPNFDFEKELLKKFL